LVEVTAWANDSGPAHQEFARRVEERVPNCLGRDFAIEQFNDLIASRVCCGGAKHFQDFAGRGAARFSLRPIGPYLFCQLNVPAPRTIRRQIAFGRVRVAAPVE
jgi:hypothetical protein